MKAEPRETVETPEQELALREALRDLIHGGYCSDVDDLRRRIYVTPFDGAYGVAGAVIAIEGTPPRALIVVSKGYGDAGMCFFREPGHAAGPISVNGYTIRRYGARSKKRRAHRAVLEYLKFAGLLHNDGSINRDAKAHVSGPLGGGEGP